VSNKFLENKVFYFPFADHCSSLHIPLDIFDEFSELINQIFFIAKLTDYDVGWVGFHQYLYVTFSKSNTLHQLIVIHDDNMYLHHLIIDWGPTNSDPIEALKDFLKKILESE
jgi:hypothetical protein